MASNKKLVIVESPTKAKTISAFLGPDYEVIASVGHIRDLAEPSELPAELKKGSFGKFGVDIDNDFAPYYIVASNKKKTVTELKRALKDSDELWLATDEDREGEAIAWHLLETLKPKVPVRRMVFHEITQEAIEHATSNTRELDENLVHAQETRRILDRLYGYDISPVLWRKVGPKLSAGRVQSAATRLVVDRERERMAYSSAEYWDLSASFSTLEKKADFSARLLTVDGKRIATGADFGDDGKLNKRAVTNGVLVLDSKTAKAIEKDITVGAQSQVASVETKPHTRRPAAPFTTSTLQQEASRKLRFTSRQTMSAAQSLYENGYITYMRTDSFTLSAQAIKAARTQAASLYGAETVPEKARVYKGKSKGAQEAHEAIRPAGDHFQLPQELKGKLNTSEFALYDLIWKRTIASQMADAKGSTDTVTVNLETANNKLQFTASGTVIHFPGFLLAYEEGKDESRGDKHREEVKLPKLEESQKLNANDPEAKEHHTSPPPRYTEASLTKRLEDLGIGRPSTYATILSTIMDRGYVTKKGQALVPTWNAFSVVRLLEEHFGALVDYDFTAEMESDLDSIASGEQNRTEWLQEFYFGSENHPGLRGVVDNLGEIDAREINTLKLDDTISIRNGKYGPYLEVVDDKCEVLETGEIKPRIVNIPEGMAPDELTKEKATELASKLPTADKELGIDPKTGLQIVVKDGRFGPYITEIHEEALPKGKKARTAALFKTMTIDEMTLETALRLLELPRVVGIDPETENEITAQNGRYGAYLKKGTDTRSLPNEESIFEIDLAGALELFAKPKYGGRKAASALKEFDADPVSGKPIKVKDGRFGPYVTDGEINATIPRGESVEDITFERAVELIAVKRAKGPTKRKTAAKKTATTKKAATTKKSTTTKKAATTAKKTTTAKKATTTKATAAKKATTDATDSASE